MFEKTAQGKRYERPILAWFIHTALGRGVAGLVAFALAVGTLALAANAVAKPEQAAAATDSLPGSAGTSTSTNGWWANIELTKTADAYLLEPGGGNVTYTYTVKNTNPVTPYNSTVGNFFYYRDAVFYDSMTDDKCANVTATSGLRMEESESFIPAGQTATFTCTTKVTSNTTNTVTALFSDYYGHAVSTTAKATVNVKSTSTDTGGTSTPWCSQILYITEKTQRDSNYNLYATGGYGTWVPGSAPSDPKALPSVGTQSGVAVKTSDAAAVTARDPGFLYYVPEVSGVDGSPNMGLWKVNVTTGATTKVVSTAAPTNRLAFDAAGTLWSFANDGHLYSLAWGTQSWVDHGSPFATDGTVFTDLTLGDIVLDGVGNMYITGAAGGVSKFFSIADAELAKSTGIRAQFIGNINSVTGPYGLAFGADGKLYLSSDTGNGSGAVYELNKSTGAVSSVVSSTSKLGYVQDLASCALPKPELKVTKTNNPSTGVASGEIVTYTVKIENLGNLEATGVNFADPIPQYTTYVAGSTNLNGKPYADVNGGFPYATTHEVHSDGAFAGVIAPQATATITYQVKVVTPIPAGVTKITNQGTVTWVGPETPTDDPKVPGGDDPTDNPVLTPAIGIDKTADKTVVDAKSPDSSARKVTYSYAVSTNALDANGTVTKEGAEPLKNVTVTDDKCSPVTPVNQPGSTKNVGDRNSDSLLDPGEVWQYTCSSDITQNTTNTAKATGDGNRSGTSVTDTDTWTVTVLQPSINAKKAAVSTTTADANGNAKVTYTVTVENTGAGTGTYAAITDKLGFDANLVPTAVSVNGSPVTLNADKSFTVDPGGTLTPTGTAGAKKTFTIVVDYRFASMTATTSTCGDGKTSGKGLFNAIEMAGDTVTTDNTACVDPQPIKGITVKKSHTGYTDANGNGLLDTGDKIVYHFQVINTGNVTLTNVNVTDEFTTGGKGAMTAITCTNTTLAAGASTTCTATYTVDATDMALTSVDNKAISHGTPPEGTPVDSTPSTDTFTPQAPTPAITIKKSVTDAGTGNGDGKYTKGEQLTYSFVVTNTGNTVLTDIKVKDTFTNGGTGTMSAITCKATTLKPDESTTCSATYVATQADVDAKHLDNYATATGTPGNGGTPVESEKSPATIPADATASISLVKKAGTPVDVNKDGLTNAGDTIVFTFVVTNTGTQVLNDVKVADPMLDGAKVAITCPKTTLAPAEPMTCTSAAYTITAADVTAGKVHNVATATGTTPGGDTPKSPESPTDTPTTKADPKLELIKSVADASGNKKVEAGETLTYSFKVTNTGNVTVNSLTISDTFTKGGTGAMSAITCPKTSLAKDESTTCTATYVATQADVDAGGVDNEAQAHGTSQTDGKSVDSNKSPATIPAEQSTKLVLTKDVKVVNDDNKDGLQDAGDSVVYTFTVTNESTVTLSSITVNDPMLAAAGVTVTCEATTLAPKASTTCTSGAYTITDADQKAGAVNNTATSTGKTSGGTTVTSNEDPATVPLVTPAPGITMTKSVADASGDKLATLGETLTYSFLVTNTGNVELTNITINETVFSGDRTKLSAITCPVTTLAPKATVTCTATYVVQQSDVDNGKVTNAATASGTTPKGDTPKTPESGTEIPTPNKASLFLDKQVSSTSFKAGDTLTYTFLVKNTGDVTVKDLKITDTFNVGGTGTLSAITCDATTLKPTESTTCRATYVANQADVDSGQLKNTATATGTDPKGGNVPSNPDTETSNPTQTPKLELVKKAGTPVDVNKDGLTNAGDTITWTFEVKNAGNVTLTDVKIDDPMLAAAGVAITCPKATLAPAEPMTCKSAPYTITAADVTAGNVHNVATAHGTTPSTPDKPGTDVPSDPSPTDTPTTKAAPKLVLDKTVADASGNGTVETGEKLTYSFLVKNEGNVVVNDLAITDTFTKGGSGTLSAITCDATTLKPSESTTCRATYVATQADVDAGGVDNKATAHGNTPTEPVTSNEDPADIPAEQTTGIELDKKADVTEVAKAGNVVTYTFTVKNTGTVTLTNVVVTDKMLKLDNQPCVTELKPGQTLDCKIAVPYTVLQSDIDAGTINNTATATGTPAGGLTPPKDDDSVIVKTIPNSKIELVKHATLNDKDGDKLGDLGETISFTFEVTNTGDVTLHDIVIDDAMLADAKVAVTCPKGDVAPAASVTCTAADYTITQADVDAGHVKNIATASGTTPGGDTPKSPESPTDTPTDQTPGIKLVKSAELKDLDADGKADKGEQIVFHFTITNTGKVTLNNVKVNDPMLEALKLAITCDPTTLAPGKVAQCTSAPYTVTQADVDNGHVHNVATATGTTPGGDTPKSPESPTDTPTDHTPKLTLVKSVNAGEDKIASLGEKLVFSFQVKNTGTVTLNDVKVDDPMLNGAKVAVTCPKTTLAPGEETTCTSAEYTVTQTDVDAGHVFNKATAHGTTPKQPEIPGTPEKPGTPEVPPTDVPSNESTTDTPTPNAKGMTLVKGATLNDKDGDNLADKDETITFFFTLTNTGDVTLKDLKVTDAKLGLTDMAVNADNCTLAPADFNGSLLPKATVVCTLKTQYTVTQADVEAGKVHNVATATGTTPGGDTPETPESPTDTPTDSTPSITIDKIATLNDVVKDGNVAGKADLNETITYSFVVTNTGKVKLTNVHVEDTMKNGALLTITCPKTELAPGEKMTCAATPYTVTQADVDAGKIDNSAVAKGTPGKPTDPNNPEVPSTPGTTTTPTNLTTAITLEKTASVTTVTAVGDPIDYTFLVKNTGTVTLTDVTVTDPMFMAPNPVIAISCPATTLIPDAEMTCKATGYKATLADLDAGAIINTATATGTPPADSGLEKPTDDGSATVKVIETPDVTIVKSSKLNDVDGDDKGDLGETISYSFVVTNKGNTTLSNVTVTDEMLDKAPNGIKVTCEKTALTPAESTTCTAAPDYAITQADVDAGNVHNVATVKGNTPGGGTPEDPSNPTDTPTDTTPGLSLVKDGDIDGGKAKAELGDTITYTFTLTNTGKVTLKNLRVDDPMLATAGVAITCSVTELAPGANTTCTSAPYTVTQTDVNAGKVINTATAHGTTPNGGDTPSNPSTHEENTDKNPLLSLKKNASLNDTNGDKIGQLGETITYSFVVTNVGTTDMAGISILDQKLNDAKVAITCPQITLAPGAFLTCTAAPYTITQADVDKGHADNVATATGHVPPKPGDNTPVKDGEPTPPSDTTTPTDSTKKLVLDKTAQLNDLNGNKLADRGETITYGFVVTNSGAQTISDLAIKDTMANGAVLEISCPITTLAPGASTTCTAKPYTVTQADVDAGSIKNAATATGNGPDGTPTESNEDKETVPGNPTATLALVKSAELHDLDGDNKADLGETITFSFMVTNTGAVTLNDIKIADEMLVRHGIMTVCPKTTLESGEAMRCVADKDYVVTQAAVNFGSVDNVATVTGVPPVTPTDPTPTPVPSNPSETHTPADKVAKLELLKTAKLADANGNGTADLGEKITFSFLVTNVGTTEMETIKVDDPLLATAGVKVTCPTDPKILKPGEKTTCTSGEYSVTAEDVKAGKVYNVATATGKVPFPPNSPVTGEDKRPDVPSNPSDTSTPIVPVVSPNPQWTLVKTAKLADANGNGFADAGETITYGFTVTNTGNVDIANVKIDDRMLVQANVAITCQGTTLMVGRTLECSSAPYTVTAADVKAGQIVNVAVAKGELPGTPGGEDKPTPVQTHESKTSTPVPPTVPMEPVLANTGAMVPAAGVALTLLVLAAGLVMVRRGRTQD